GRAVSVAFDVTDPRKTAAAWKTVTRKAGPVDVLVNTAGVTVFKSFARTSLAEFQTIVATNLLGPVGCLKAVLPDMIRRRRGWVFNILSNAAVKTFEGSSAYTATKAGMLGFGRVLREELRGHDIRVVSILPGATDTPMWSPGARKRHRRKMMSASGVAEAVVSAYLMPADVVVDEMVIRPIGGDIG
ncbi:MAG TPA: SDR family NAD(P)-dependent oxidoreductase, partial [Bacteroidota bacterium]|nr:SDR family NAD(P)-dependent oxidoreductase [Bacteroidota bacterium]